MPNRKRSHKSKAQIAARNAEVVRTKAEYRKLAKRANTRMLRLERLAENPEYKAVLGYAYKNVANDLKRLGSNAKYGRFPMDILRFSAEETDLGKLNDFIAKAKDFLAAPSSTKTGIDKVYNQRADTLNKKMGTSFSGNDMKTWFDSTTWKKISAKYGSKTAMKVIAKVQDNAEKIRADIEDARLRHKKIDIEELHDVDGLDLSRDLSSRDKSIIYNLAEIYSRNY